MSKAAFSTGMIAVIFITARFNPVVNAQIPPEIFGDVTIQHPFSPDPLILRGMSGGSVEGSKIAGKIQTPITGVCQGFMEQKPSHKLKLVGEFKYLKLLVQGPADTTMIIKGPGGTWCNDDFNGKNPGIVGEWLPGTYQIWIGSYKEDESLPYTLKITEGK